MFYEDIEDHSPEHFHRATGVSKTLFSEMLYTLEAAGVTQICGVDNGA